MRATATGNARSPTVEHRVDGTSSVDMSAERRRRHASMSVTLVDLIGSMLFGLNKQCNSVDFCFM